MPRKKCGFGFSCAAMMMQPGLDAQYCPNAEVCGLITELSEDEQVELLRVTEAQAEQLRQGRDREWSEQLRYAREMAERRRVTAFEAATMMLRQRGAPQSLEDFEIPAALDTLMEDLQSLTATLATYEDLYIAPDNCEVHEYATKRPYGKYWYNKLLAQTAIFAPAVEEDNVRVIHLSHYEDPRNIEGRRGIERCNRLHQIKTQLQAAQQALDAAIAIAQAPLPEFLVDVDEAER